MGLILDISPRVLEKVLYFASYIVLDPMETTLDYKQVLSEKEFREAYEEFGGKFRVGMGEMCIRDRFKKAKTKVVKNNTYLIKKLKSGKAYYLRVRAVSYTHRDVYKRQVVVNDVQKKGGAA